MPDLVTDWRSWTNQQEIESSLAFPGMNAFTDVEIISNNSPSTLSVTGATNSGTTVTLTVASTSYTAESGGTETLVVGQVIGVTGITGFSTNNPNGTWVLTAVTATTVQFVVTDAPTGSYSSGGVIQPSEVFAAGTLGSVSIPTYNDSPTLINAVDPFGGWTAQQESEVTQFTAAHISAISYAGSSPNYVATITTATDHNIAAVGMDVTLAFSSDPGSLAGTYTVTAITDSTHFKVSTTTHNPAYTNFATNGGTVTVDPQARPSVTGLT